MAYVDTEKVLETARNGCHSDFGRSMADLTSLREVLEDTPTADVVEVVRCKECEHSCKYQKFNFSRYLGCDFNGEIYEVEPNHFCSYGERRDT